MSYDVTKLATLGHLQTLAQRTVSAINDAIADIPTEQFLDQAHTAFVANFTFSAQSYPGATNPSLDGKPVLVLAVKGIDHANNDAETTAYSFLNMETLVDTYTAKAGDSAKILNISGYEIEVKIDPDANNAITVTNNGLKVDISGKADKVASATANNVATLDANGNLTDSGILKTNILLSSNVATATEVTEVMTEVFGA